MKITLTGIVVFVILVVAFFWWFGGPPHLPDDLYPSRRGVQRTWYYCSLLFVMGAWTACFGDHEYGLFPPTSLRWLFIVLGVIVMGASTLWMHSVLKAWAPAVVVAI